MGASERLRKGKLYRMRPAIERAEREQSLKANALRPPYNAFFAPLFTPPCVCVRAFVDICVWAPMYGPLPPTLTLASLVQELRWARMTSW